MKKIIRLTESDLTHIVRRVIREQEQQSVFDALNKTLSTIPKKTSSTPPQQKKPTNQGPQKCSDMNGKIDDIWAYHVKAFKPGLKKESGDGLDPYSYVQLNSGIYCVNKKGSEGLGTWVTVTAPNMIEVVKKQLIGYQVKK